MGLKKHKQIYIEGQYGTLNTTLCNRVSSKTGDGYMNIAESDDKITCKLCLRIRRKRKGND